MHALTGALLAANDWTGASGRPDGHLPPTMVGGVERFVGLGTTGIYQSVAATGVTVIDSSIDWRNRVFSCDAQFAFDSGGVAHYAWQTTLGGSRVPSVGANLQQHRTLGQSFVNDAQSLTGVAGSLVLHVTPTSLSAMAPSSEVALFVRASDGALCAWVSGAADPGGRFFFWLRASGPFANVNQ